MTSLFSKFSVASALAGLLVLTAGAQTSGHHGTTGMEQGNTAATLTISAPPSANCPVAMRAQHGVDGSVVAVSSKGHQGVGQQLELTLKNPGNTAISGVRITVHGWNGSLHTLPARAINSNGTNTSKTLELNVSIAPHKSAKADLWIGGLSSVDSIDIIEVRYTKGLNWRASATHACRIVPDAETLISQR